MNQQNNNTPFGFFFKPEDDPDAFNSVTEFRKALFVDRLGWKLRVCGQQEVDEFDTPDASYAVLADRSGILGCFRAIRADNDYLAEKIFPNLATLRGYPKQTSYWEVSRFGVWPGPEARVHSAMLYALMFQFALIRRAKALVAVTDLFHERYLSQRSIRTRRYGMPQVCGTDVRDRPITLVAGEIPIASQQSEALQDLFTTLNGVSINDKALVFGRSRLQA